MPPRSAPPTRPTLLLLAPLLALAACAPTSGGAGADPQAPSTRGAGDPSLAHALSAARQGAWALRKADDSLAAARHWRVTLTLAGSSLRVVDLREVPGRLPTPRAQPGGWRAVFEDATGSPVAAVSLPEPAPLRAELANPDGTVESFRFEAAPRTFSVRLADDPTGDTVRLFSPEPAASTGSGPGRVEAGFRERASAQLASVTP